MPVELAELVGPGRPAVLTMEIQRGVVGDLSSFPALADEVDRRGVVENTARLLAGARRAGVPVVHCTAGFRSDRRGSPSNAPLMTAVLRRPEHLLEGTGAVELVPELGAQADDLMSHRRHGVSPFV
ncbi:MAG: cysteine hydrolase family protein, partial [Acidimicrobiales bacterium]